MVYWCAGQYAAAYYMNKSKVIKKKPLFKTPLSSEHAKKLIKRALTILTYKEKSQFKFALTFKDKSSCWFDGEIRWLNQ